MAVVLLVEINVMMRLAMPGIVRFDLKAEGARKLAPNKYRTFYADCNFKLQFA